MDEWWQWSSSLELYNAIIDLFNRINIFATLRGYFFSANSFIYYHKDGNLIAIKLTEPTPVLK